MVKDFNKLILTLKSSIKTWDYFVNWQKVFKNSSGLEISLNKLNYLLGKENLREEFKTLFASNPDVANALPVLLAVREKKLEIVDILTRKSEFFYFTNEKNADKCFDFIEKSGLIRLFKQDGIKNLVDYAIGVEVGLDSNGRKNRGGDIMEKIVELYIEKFCKDRGFEYISQASPTQIKDKWGISVKINKSERSFDFAIYNPSSRILKVVEVNFYNGGGSKLKAVCGEFRDLYSELKTQNIDLIWITDGQGWQTTRRPLEETYNHNEYVFNLSMLESEILSEMNW